MADTGRVDLTDLNALAREYADTLGRVNAPLPDDFPAEHMREVTTALLSLDGSPSEDEQRGLVYARGKLREVRKILRIQARDPEAPSYFEIERAHNALFAELDALVEAIPPPILLDLQPSSRDGSLVVRRTEFAGKIAALEQRVSAVEAQSRDACTRIDHRRTVISLIYIETLRLQLGNLIKVATTLRAELKASLIDLKWVVELTKRLNEISTGLSQALDTARNGAGQIADIIASAEKARRLAERVVAGGKALLGWTRRIFGRGISDTLVAGQRFRDINAPWCPEMVVVPSGSFTMGSAADEEYREGHEGPQHRVTFAQRSAVARYPVTFEEYDQFAEATGRERPRDEDWGRGRRPVINVSWNDTKAYVAWLGEQTGQPYRLLSEAEWEYACRAGTTTTYSSGDDFSAPMATYNLADDGTTEVGANPPNPWGLYDMHGNVWEWVEDCWNNSYEGAPIDGSAWTGGDCNHRVLRGGSWMVKVFTLRSAQRASCPADSRHQDVGFRVARTL